MQAFHHIAFNCGLLPTVGTPLPFLSAGAPNILFSWAALGLLLSASRSQHASENATAVAARDDAEISLWKPRRRWAVQLFFVLYALLLVARLCAIVTNERLERAVHFQFDREVEKRLPAERPVRTYPVI